MIDILGFDILNVLNQQRMFKFDKNFFGKVYRVCVKNTNIYLPKLYENNFILLLNEYLYY